MGVAMELVQPKRDMIVRGCGLGVLRTWSLSASLSPVVSDIPAL